MTLLVSEGIHSARYGIEKVRSSLNIFFTDLLPTNITCMLPNSIRWAYRRFWLKSIKSYSIPSLSATAAKASLYAHDVFSQESKKVQAVLLLHGEHAHPFTTLHLADIAQEEGRRVFSVKLVYDDDNPENHKTQLRKSIAKIRDLVEADGNELSELVAVGHSRGAIVAAHETFVENSTSFSGIFSLAGRFKVIEPSSKPCRESLKATVHSIWQKIGLNRPPLKIPFIQVGASLDWCMDPESSIIRDDQKHLLVNAGHLGVINHPSSLQFFRQTLKEGYFSKSSEKP